MTFSKLSYIFFFDRLRDKWGIKVNQNDRYLHHMPSTHNILFKKEKIYIQEWGPNQNPRESRKKERKK